MADRYQAEELSTNAAHIRYVPKLRNGGISVKYGLTAQKHAQNAR